MTSEKKREYMREWRAAHPEKLAEYRRKWKQEHPNYNTEKSKRWADANPARRHEISLKAQRRYRETHPNLDREYYEANKDMILEQMKGYAAANKEAISERHHNYYRESYYKIQHPHRAIWEDYFGIKIPAGFVVHHKDLCPTNNDPHNLLCLEDSEHKKLHWSKRKE